MSKCFADDKKIEDYFLAIDVAFREHDDTNIV